METRLNRLRRHLTSKVLRGQGKEETSMQSTSLSVLKHGIAVLAFVLSLSLEQQALRPYTRSHHSNPLRLKPCSVVF